MKIRFKKSRLRFYMIMTIFWAVLLILNIYNGPHDHWPFYLWIIMPVLYITQYSFDYYKQYLTLENGFIYRNSFFPKKLELGKIKKFKKFAGDYILETDEMKLRIDTSLIEESSLDDLNRALSAYQN